jgi:hypothetical protein
MMYHEDFLKKLTGKHYFRWQQIVTKLVKLHCRLMTEWLILPSVTF